MRPFGSEDINESVQNLSRHIETIFLALQGDKR